MEYWKEPCSCGCGEKIGMLETVFYVQQSNKMFKVGHELDYVKLLQENTGSVH